MAHVLPIALLATSALSAPPPGIQPAQPPTAEPAPAANEPAAPPSPVPFPHPLLCEILYAVPSGVDGDATGDGKRDAAGDEFVELVNPHDRPINLRGYKLTDRNEPDKGQLRFVFPAVEVPPRGVVVVFNGNGAKWEGPVGDSRKAPDAGHDRFAGARVFTMKGTSSLTSWANGGDWVLLTDPSGAPVQCVWWGKFAEPIPETGLVEQAPLCTRSSITLDGLTGSWTVHYDIDDAMFSPGRFVAGDEPPAPAEPVAADPPPPEPAPAANP